MKKKEIKKTKLKPRKKAEVKRDQYTVVLEDVRRQFGVMKEGFSGLHKKIDRNYEEFVEFRKETNNNFKTLFEFRNEMIGFRSETNDNFKVNFEYLSKIDDELQSIKVEIADLKTKLKGKAEVKKLMQLEERVVVAEKKLETIVF